MSYSIRTYDPSRIAKMYFAEGHGATADTVKNREHCDDIINASFYHSKKGKLESSFHLKNDGEILGDPGWTYTGMLWNNPSRGALKFHMGKVPDESYDFYVSGYILLSPTAGMDAPLDKNIPSRNAKRARTLLGVKADGKIVIYLCSDGSCDSMTAAQSRQKMHDLGCIHAIMLDGGGSTQCNFSHLDKREKGVVGKGNWTIHSQRKVYNYLCINIKDPTDTAPAPVTPAPVPDKKPETPNKNVKTFYRVQVGAFTVINNARRLLAELKQKGFSDAYLQDVTINGVDYHRVQIGSFGVKSNAINLMSKIKKNGYSAFIQTVELPA